MKRDLPRDPRGKTVRLIDSSSLAKFFSREEGWERVREVMLEGVSTLDLAIKELASALWKKVLRNEMAYDTARTVIEDLAEEKAIPTVDQGRFLTWAFALAVNERITVYDAMFIAAARELKMELVTSDRKQMEVAVRNGVRVVFVE